MVANLRKLHITYIIVLRILVQAGGDVKTSGIFSKAVLQSVLIFVSETFVVNNHLIQVLESLYVWFFVGLLEGKLGSIHTEYGCKHPLGGDL